MQVFLDANILYKDPFLKTGYLSLLKRLAKDGHIQLFISESAYKDVLHHFQNQYVKLITDAKYAAHHMNYLLKKSTVTVHVTEEELVQYFEENFFQNVHDGVIQIIPLDERILHKVIELELSPIEPFFHPIKDVEGQHCYRKNIQEAITWYTYANYISAHDLQDSYFITNKIEHFADVRRLKNMDAFLPHPNLAHHRMKLCFKSVRGYLNYFPELLRFSLTSNVDEILGEYLVQFAKANLNVSVLHDILAHHLIDNIEFEIMEKLLKLKPSAVHPDYQFPGHFVPKELIDCQHVQIEQIILYRECFLISCQMTFHVNVDVYVHPIVYLESHDPQLLYSSETLLVNTNVSFFVPISLNREKWRDKMDGIEDLAAMTLEKQEDIWQYLLSEFNEFYNKIDLQHVEMHEVEVRNVDVKNKYTPA